MTCLPPAEQSAKRRKTMRQIRGAAFEPADAASYAEQLAAKKRSVEELFKDIAIPQIEVHESEYEHHRMRQV